MQDIPAVGKTATQLQEYIAGELTKYIEQPIVSVIVNTPEGNFTQQVRIIGATPQPASLPFRANMTVLDALIAVGGLNEFAAGNRAKLIRQDRESGDQLEYRLRLSDLVRRGEAREPLLDHRLVEFAARLPERMRVRGGLGKYLLKKSLERYLSHDILYRPKQGFVTPIAEWLRGPLAGAARGIATGDLAQTGFFKPQAIAALAEAHIAGRADHSRTLWQFLMLEKSLTRLEVSA